MGHKQDRVGWRGHGGQGGVERTWRTVWDTNRTGRTVWGREDMEDSVGSMEQTLRTGWGREEGGMERRVGWSGH